MRDVSRNEVQLVVGVGERKRQQKTVGGAQQGVCGENESLSSNSY